MTRLILLPFTAPALAVGVAARARAARRGPPPRCCGAPWLHAGDVDRFRAAARRNVAALAESVRAGRDVVVAQPTCSYVIRRDYPIYAPGADADLVAAHPFDAGEYLANFHRKEDVGLDNAVSGAIWGGFANAGQTCSGIERVYVVREVADDLRALCCEGERQLEIAWARRSAASADPTAELERFLREQGRS